MDGIGLVSLMGYGLVSLMDGIGLVSLMGYRASVSYGWDRASVSYGL